MIVVTLAKALVAVALLELVSIATVGATVLLAVSDVIGGAAIAAGASVLNTALLVAQRRNARQRIGDPDAADKDQPEGSALAELAGVRRDLKEAREQLLTINRLVSRRRELFRPEQADEPGRPAA